MKTVGWSVLAALLIVSSASAQYYREARPGYAAPQRYFGHGPIKKDELEYQQKAFKQWWGDEYVTELSDLPAEGKVPDFRVPYVGHDYPDRGGGTVAAMWKYDQAFHGRRPLATQAEQNDINEHRAAGGEERVVYGLFGRARTVRGRAVPTWYGHCNGWTAAAIRHAEPQRNVVRNGVVFTPADIKGLLAEIYMYGESEFLGGVDPAINPGTLHLTLANWLGRGEHPLGMESAIGEVVINFPLFAYKSTINNYSSREAEVRTTITYALNINREMDKQPAKYHRQLHFHYVLELDAEGSIKGGRYYGDSGQIDMLWAPLKPAQGGEEGNKRGNRHLDVKEVLAIWRESVAEDLRKQWLNIDPTEEDRILPPEAIATAEPPADSTVSSANDQTAATTNQVATTAAPDAEAEEDPPVPTAPPATERGDSTSPSGETSGSSGGAEEERREDRPADSPAEPAPG